MSRFYEKLDLKIPFITVLPCKVNQIIFKWCMFETSQTELYFWRMKFVSKFEQISVLRFCPKNPTSPERKRRHTDASNISTSELWTRTDMRRSDIRLQTCIRDLWPFDWTLSMRKTVFSWTRPLNDVQNRKRRLSKVIKYIQILEFIQKPSALQEKQVQSCWSNKAESLKVMLSLC